MRLTAEQETTIQKRVDEQGLVPSTLRDDIIDHLSCVVENSLEKEKPFEQLLDEAIQKLAPNGLLEIQQMTIFLLNSKRIIMMKRLMYTTGFIGAVILTAGATFKLLYLPYGGPLFIVGSVLLFLVFFPLLALDKYKVAISKTISVRLKFVFGFSAALFIGVSVMFKIMHLQGAPLLLAIGSLLFAFGFLPFFFFTMYKGSISSVDDQVQVRQ